MKRYTPKRMRWLFTNPVLLLLLTLILCACNPDVGSGRSGSPTASTQHDNTHTVPTPEIQLGRQPCPGEVKDLAHWKGIVGIDSTQTVEGVLCGFLMGVPTLQAVVKVRSASVDRLLDIHVYTAITSTNPTQIFSLRGLLLGDAAVSNYNTLMTAQADPNSSQNKGVPLARLQTDFYREFKWSDSAGTLIQVAFSGIYPDLTRYQAEFEQGQINKGQGFQQWRLSAVTTAQFFAEFVLMWDPDAPATVVSGGGAHDAMAVILVKNPSPGGQTIRVSLSRLELNTNGGIWEVTSIEAPGMSITSPHNAQHLSSPVTVTGSTGALAGKMTTITVLDHDRTDIGHAILTTGQSSFTTSVPYAASFPGTTQEGIVALYVSPGNGVIAATVMVKVLLNG
ncbi:MAG TPA: hypothetical protein VF043_25530 [Ktedonobacteraceae bacterium]